MVEITSAKGSKLGYIHHSAEFTIVLWKTGESITFVGPASVILGKVIVDVDNEGIHCPKSLTKPANVRKEIVSYLENVACITTTSGEAFHAGYRQAIDDTVYGFEDRVWLLEFEDTDPYFLGYMSVVKALNPN